MGAARRAGSGSVVKKNVAFNFAAGAAAPAPAPVPMATAITTSPPPPASKPMDEEWHQKYAFMLGLLRKPHAVLLKECLNREQDKLVQKLAAYHLERTLIRERFLKRNSNNGKKGEQNYKRSEAGTGHNHNHNASQSQSGSGSACASASQSVSDSTSRSESLSLQLKHLDLMCVTLERQIDVLNNVEQTIPRNTDNIYSGEPDSLDGTSSEIILNDEDESRERDGGVVSNDPNNHGSNFQITINGRSPLDVLAMLHLERCAHRESRKELNQLRKKYELLRDEFDSGEGMSASTSLLFSCMNEEAQLERVRDELTLQNYTLKAKLAELSARISDSTTYRLEKHTHVVHKSSTGVGTGDINNLNNNNNGRHGDRGNEDDENELYSNINNNNNTINNLTMSVDLGRDAREAAASASDELRLRRKSTYKIGEKQNGENSNDACGGGAELVQLRTLVNDLQHKEEELSAEGSNLRNQLESERAARRESEKCILSLESQLEASARRLEMMEQCLMAREEEASALKLDVDTLNEENRRLKDDLNALHAKIEKEQSRSLERFSKFEREIGAILEQNKLLQEDFNRERVLRKKYYNMVEELKGKIRVFCRIRPLARSERAAAAITNEIIASASDSYTVTVQTSKGPKEFSFDHVFSPEESQEQIFADTKNLIQSAFDGYSVSICAYGQTGSGKTYTILGDESCPGIAPRTFCEVFSLASEMGASYETSISFYILELYNDKLIDLLNLVAPHPLGGCGGSSNLSTNTTNTASEVRELEREREPTKLEIRRDRRGTVWVSGARVLVAEDSSSLERLFRAAISSRHTASTRMNDKSSRSHLIIGLIIETTSKVNGTVLRGKISLLDLAGSERIGKSGASADTLREANAINKSLSAFGDVINALTTDQSFVPYRNNKLTLLMQDSLGGNAKTLMFVNISPAAYNLEESLVSLAYASRVKQVTNGPTRNIESKEIARLKQIIAKLKRGENISTDDEVLWQ